MAGEVESEAVVFVFGVTSPCPMHTRTVVTFWLYSGPLSGLCPSHLLRDEGLRTNHAAIIPRMGERGQLEKGLDSESCCLAPGFGVRLGGERATPHFAEPRWWVREKHLIAHREDI